MSCQRSLRLRRGCTKDLCCHLFFIEVVDFVTEFAREGALNELLYVDDLMMMSETIEGVTNKFLKWKQAFGSKGLKVSHWKTKVVVSSPHHQSPRCGA